MNRNEAIDKGLLTYPTPKPCRRGHTGDRYTSNGMCVQCLKDQKSTMADARKQRRLIRNNILAQEASKVEIHVKLKYKGLLDRILAVINNGTDDHIVRLQLTAEELYRTLERPGAWSKRDILAAGVETDGYGITNLHRWEYDDRKRIGINGTWFDGVTFMAVLRGHIQWVTPDA